MPSLRAHVVFLNTLRDAASVWSEPLGDELVRVLAHDWPEAVAGSLAPDTWPLFGGTRVQMHALLKDDPSTWAGAVERWLAASPIPAAGRRAPGPTAAFLLGYLSHIGFDTWSLYVDPALPDEVRARSPATWLPPALLNPPLMAATLRRYGEVPIAPNRHVDAATLTGAAVPDGFPPTQADAIRRLAAGMVPAIAEADPWRISRINPIRPQPDTPAARQEWQVRRDAQPEVTPEHKDALGTAALDFTCRILARWW